MPTISVDKADLWDRLGREYSSYYILLIWPIYLVLIFHLATAEFDQLCFDYGLELDEDVCLAANIRSQVIELTGDTRLQRR